MRPRRAALAGVLVAFAGANVPGKARAAEPVPVKLEWVAPSTCPSGDAVLAEVARILGSAGSTSRKAVTARAVVSRRATGRWEVALTTHAGAWTGERSLGADSCRALANATALILALTVDPEHASPPPSVPSPAPLPPATTAIRSQPPSPPTAPSTRTSTSTPTSPSPPTSTSPSIPRPTSTSTSPPPPTPPPTQPSTSSSTPPPTAPAPTTTPAPTPTPAEAPQTVASPRASAPKPEGPSSTSPRRAHRFAVGAAGTVGAGSLPNPTAVGAELSLAWRPGPLRIEAAGTYWGPQSVNAVSPVKEGGRFTLLSLEARGCFVFAVRFVELSPCAVVEGDSLAASGFGPPQATRSLSGTGRWVLVGGGGLVTWSLTRWLAVRLGAEAGAPLTRPAFVIESSGGPSIPVHQPGVIAGKGTIGLEVRFF